MVRKIIQTERNSYSSGHFLVSGVGATAYAGTWYDRVDGYEPFARSDDEQATVMLVQGTPGNTVEVVRLETGLVIGQTTIPVAGWQFDHSYPCQLSEPMQIGDTYVVRYAGSITDGDSTRVLCVARHGLPGESIPSGLTFGSVASPRGAYLGNPEFAQRRCADDNRLQHDRYGVLVRATRAWWRGSNAAQPMGRQPSDLPGVLGVAPRIHIP